jgi:hypothetical protein
MCIKINKIGKQEVGIWWVQKRFPRYGVPIWSLWPNIRFLPSIVAEKNAKEGRPDRQMDRGKTVYPPPPPRSGGINTNNGPQNTAHHRHLKQLVPQEKSGENSTSHIRHVTLVNNQLISHVTLVNNQLISHVTLVNNQLISHEKGKKEGFVTMTKETYPLSSVNECKWKYLF